MRVRLSIVVLSSLGFTQCATKTTQPSARSSALQGTCNLDTGAVAYHHGRGIHGTPDVPTPIYIIYYGQQWEQSDQQLIEQFLNDLSNSPWAQILTTFTSAGGVTDTLTQSFTIAGKVQDPGTYGYPTPSNFDLNQLMSFYIVSG